LNLYGIGKVKKGVGMKKIFTIICCLGSILTFTGIGTAYCDIYYTPSYKFVLESVEGSGNKLKHTLSRETLQYEDGIIDITWKPRHKYFAFTLQNKLASSIKILWDEVVFINHLKVNQGAIHQGVKYSQMNNPQVPTKLIRKSKVDDIIAPKNNIMLLSFSFSNTTKWVIRDILAAPGKNVGTFNTDDKEDAIDHAKQYVGSVLTIMLPIKTKKETVEYIFTFKVNSFDIVPYDEDTY